MIIAVILIALMCRILADMIMSVFFYFLQVNHYRTPKPGWQTECAAFLLAMTLWAPIVNALP